MAYFKSTERDVVNSGQLGVASPMLTQGVGDSYSLDALIPCLGNWPSLVSTSVAFLLFLPMSDLHVPLVPDPSWNQKGGNKFFREIAQARYRTEPVLTHTKRQYELNKQGTLKVYSKGPLLRAYQHFCNAWILLPSQLCI